MTLLLHDIVLTSSMLIHLSSSQMYISWIPKVPFEVFFIYNSKKRFISSIMLILTLIINECKKFFTHNLNGCLKYYIFNMYLNNQQFISKCIQREGFWHFYLSWSGCLGATWKIYHLVWEWSVILCFFLTNLDQLLYYQLQNSRYYFELYHLC